MYNFSLAIQLYSVRDEMEKDFEGTLKKVKSLGYDGVEFAGLFGHGAKEVKEMCSKIGLNPISAHVSLGEMMQDPETFNTYNEIGCKYIVIPSLPEEYRLGQPKFKDLIEIIKSFGKKANSLGMKLCYHNHDFEFAKTDGKYALDVLYDSVPADLLSTQLDTCWVNVGGANPTEYIHKYAGRIEIIHLKDFKGSRTDNMYALIGVPDDRKEKTSDNFELRPLGYGVQDFPSIIKASHDAGAKWLVVEQDEPSMGKTPLECAELSINYLKKIL